MIDGEFFLGIQHQYNTLQGQLGFAVSTTSNARPSGIIWDDADPRFDNHVYHYQIRHTHVALKSKLSANSGHMYSPWLSASVGIGFNQAHDFNNAPLLSEAVAMPNFSSNTKITLTYTLGVGVQKELTKNWQVGLGYELADWGKSQFGRTPEQTLGTGLTLNHLYTHGVLLNITYLA